MDLERAPLFPLAAAAWLLAAPGCVPPAPATDPPPTFVSSYTGALQAGATPLDEAVAFAVRADPATRVEVWIYAEPLGAPAATTLELARTDEAWVGAIPRSELDAAGVETVYYGLRAWGPSWPWDPAWAPGSDAGFVADVDGEGHRFNPNKLLIDPYARELSHDPVNAEQGDYSAYLSGPDHRLADSGPQAPKGIVLDDEEPEVAPLAGAPLRDQVIYEVHLRGLTRNDPSIPEALRGTYAGAALRAPYLADLGVTAIELLPVMETQNDQNDIDPETAYGDNYWGYSSLSFFAPDRRYAADQGPGGPTREFREMVRAFHDEGISVYLDVVYNHTAESGTWDAEGQIAPLLSWRGLDNPGLYELAADPAQYRSDNGVGPNVNAATDAGRQLVLDSLHYWVEEMGVDGFRFDLAPVMANGCARECYSFEPDDPDGLLRRIHEELPDTILIAEPWAITWGTYQDGNFPDGWAEWNAGFRDELRRDQNRMGIDEITPGQLANRLSGSWERYGDDGRPPWSSINYLVSHDGFTLRDLYSCNAKDNDQDWPYGPSDGGADDEPSWDHGGDPEAQRHAARTGIALLALSAGVPMITGGDEFFRTQRCNNNPYNLDSVGTWLDPAAADEVPELVHFTREALRFRAAHPALRPGEYRPVADDDGDGVDRVTWYTTTGVADAAYLDDPDHHFLAFRLDGDEVGDPAASIFVAYNGWDAGLDVQLPPPAPGRSWYFVADTHPWFEGDGSWLAPGEEWLFEHGGYLLGGRSVLVLIER